MDILHNNTYSFRHHSQHFAAKLRMDTTNNHVDLDDAELDVIAIEKLQLPNGVLAPDIWGRPAREQPSLISVRIELRGTGFRSAADGDTLDESTIHYGQLAKRIRGSANDTSRREGVRVMLDHTHAAIKSMATPEKSAKPFLVACATAVIDLPHASMAGDGVTVAESRWYDECSWYTRWKTKFSVRNVRISTLVGVNDYERQRKQPLVVSLQLDMDVAVLSLSNNVFEAMFTMEDLLTKVGVLLTTCGVLRNANGLLRSSRIRNSRPWRSWRNIRFNSYSSKCWIGCSLVYEPVVESVFESKNLVQFHLQMHLPWKFGGDYRVRNAAAHHQNVSNFGY